MRRPRLGQPGEQAGVGLPPTGSASLCTGFLVLVTAALVVGGCSVPASTTPTSTNPTVEALTAEVQRLRERLLAAATPPEPLPIRSAVSIPTPTPTAEPPPNPTSTPEPSPSPISLEDAVELIKSYTVFVRTDTVAGSGISIGDGQVLTNYHVVGDTARINVHFSDGRQASARLVRFDGTRDLALLQSSMRDIAIAEIRDSDALRQGETLIAAGYPRSFQIGTQDVTITSGIFSARWRSPDGVWYVQTSVALNPGNSGGPIADGRGRVVGVATWGLRGATLMNFGVASSEVIAFLGGERAAPGTVPTVRSPTALSPADTVQRFYNLIHAGDFDAAWNLLGPGFKAEWTYLAWVSGYGTTRGVHVLSAVPLGEAGSSARVAVDVSSVDVEDGRTVTKRFQGTWDLVFLGGAWRLDTARVRQVE